MDKVDYIDYKKAEVLVRFVQERGKILPRRITGTCSRHQRWLTVAIKRARNFATALRHGTVGLEKSGREIEKRAPENIEVNEHANHIAGRHFEKLGNRGELVEVAKGYARNFLLPRKLGLEATPGNMKRLEKMRAAFVS